METTPGTERRRDSNFVLDSQPLRGWNASGLEIGADEEDVVAIEADVESGELKHAVEEETGDDQEDQGKCDLRTDDPFAGTKRRPVIGLFGLAALHGGGEGNASRTEGGKNAEQNTGEDGDGGGESENAAVEREVEEDILSSGGKITDQESGSPAGKEKSE